MKAFLDHDGEVPIVVPGLDLLSMGIRVRTHPGSQLRVLQLTPAVNADTHLEAVAGPCPRNAFWRRSRRTGRSLASLLRQHSDLDNGMFGACGQLCQSIAHTGQTIGGDKAKVFLELGEPAPARVTRSSRRVSLVYGAVAHGLAEVFREHRSLPPPWVETGGPP